MKRIDQTNMHRPASARWIGLILAALLTVCVFLPGTAASADDADTVVRVGWIALPGLQDNDDGVISGYTYDYLMNVASYTGWTYEFVPGDLTSILTMLETGEIDVVGGLLYSEERALKYDMSQSAYGQSYLSLFTSLNSPLEAYDFESFEGIRVGLIDNATVNIDLFHSFAEENGFSYTEVPYPDSASLEAAVISGEVDAGMRGAYQANENTKILAEFSPSPIYFAITKGNDDVLVGLNRAINQLQIDNPYLQIELYKKYFSSQSVKLTDAELAIVSASQETPITVGVVDSSAPLFYLNSETGEYEGITIDTLKLVAEKTGLNFTYVPVDMSRAANATTPTATSPKIVVGITRMSCVTDSRGWYLSDALVGDSLVLVGRQGNDITSNPSEKKLALMEGFSIADNYAATYLSEYEVVKYDDLEACMHAVADGKADAALYVKSCISYLLQKPYFDKLEILPSYSDDIDMVVAAFVDENKALISIINKGLSMITDEEIRNITLNYTVMNPYQLTAADLLYKYKLPLIIIALLLLAVIASLATLYMFRRRSSRELQSAYEQEKAALAVAEQASAAKGNFMSRMSHEIRTPLNAIIGYNTLASSDIAEAKTDVEYRQAVMKVADCLTKSNIASKHLLTIINDVLDMSAIESGKIKIVHDRFDFKGLVHSLTTIFYSQAKAKGVDFEVVFDTLTEEWFVGDQMRTSQVLTNILSNAVKFTQDGGKVQLTICQPEAKENAAHIHFEVSDTGIGMSPEYLEHIWTPFEQADASISRRFGGTGLGLSITKNLVDLMGGTIVVESELGKGSKFCIDLTFERTEQPSSSGSYDFSTVNALVVDDDVSTCDYIRLLMGRFGARCSSVTSGYDAIDVFTAAQADGEPFTVCLVDWRMPKMDGLETVKRIRAVAGNDIPIIVITAYDFSEIVDKASEAGITKFISKPLFQSSLFDLLANICGIKAAQKDEKHAASVSFVGSRVLLAEDNAMNMEIARRILESTGLTVDSAWNGQEAVNLFESSPVGTYQAVLMDVQMPVLDGHAATRAIRASEHPEAASIPIIAMTADAFAENVAEAHASGMNDHIAKPIDLHTLFDTLEKYIEPSAKVK